MNQDIFFVIVTGFVGVMLVMFGFWTLQVRSQNAGVIDLGWALSLVLLLSFLPIDKTLNLPPASIVPAGDLELEKRSSKSGMYSVRIPGYGLRKFLIFFMVALWAARLSFY